MKGHNTQTFIHMGCYKPLILEGMQMQHNPLPFTTEYLLKLKKGDFGSD
jgi:hypothetical protein